MIACFPKGQLVVCLMPPTGFFPLNLALDCCQDGSGEARKTGSELVVRLRQDLWLLAGRNRAASWRGLFLGDGEMGRLPLLICSKTCPSNKRREERHVREKRRQQNG
ncbi:hypothetical protein LY78DRAFT_481263 [Colletotrichum sublineola]|nr:hypothetical protein LY78DRAFT_481263 [Colletotrichum sublineola]